tara:strand:+ start:2045 stop:2227 length:183 start_codon:yes stop_codon:yes gene_type:complete
MKKRRRRKLIKIRRRGVENPGGYGAPVSIGMGAYTIEGKIPTFKEYYSVTKQKKRKRTRR